MASTCLKLWPRCPSVLRSKTVDLALQYSTNVRHCPAALQNSVNVPVGCPMALRSQVHPRCILGVRTYCNSHAKAQTTEAKYSDTGELSGVDIVLHKNPISQQLCDGGMPLKHLRTAFDLDGAPRLSALEEITDEEAIRIEVPSTLPPLSISLSDYVNKSETLSKLVQLGVNIWKVQQRPNVGSMLLRLDFQTDVAPRLVFLKEIGVEDSRLGYLISHNPFILTESLENLHARVAYLRSKKFSSDAVASMVSRAPYLLNFSVKRLDNRLEFFQQQLGLNPQKTRDVVARLPRLLCGSLEPIKENLQMCKLEFGFHDNDIQHIVTTIPKVLTANKWKLTQIFDYIHNTMKIPHSLIVKFPQVLNSKYLRIRERHLFMQYLGKAQYDPSKPNYISLDRLVSLPDEVFCTDMALATLEDFEMFQKTL